MPNIINLAHFITQQEIFFQRLQFWWEFVVSQTKCFSCLLCNPNLKHKTDIQRCKLHEPGSADYCNSSQQWWQWAKWASSSMTVSNPTDTCAQASSTSQTWMKPNNKNITTGKSEKAWLIVSYLPCIYVCIAHAWSASCYPLKKLIRFSKYKILFLCYFI